ncbi:Glycoside hydrolase, family 28 [Cynara cardunculus var. scolymus]|uniref:Glycoside hydrolase, family 28 n=1 Tax=Cynara cardunculus var. scolymus TaxID=59895 RepID=A0A103XGL6_CYNCS|nr:Glycoside hydrolase, family 28 [Cynara cardunculus var. scolymus]
MQAFVNAWTDLCKENSDPTLIIPSGKTFLTSCVSFIGPCSSSRVYIKLLGNITAPKTIEGWKGCDTSGQLLLFGSVQGLTAYGPGQFDGYGSIWWPRSARVKFLDHLNNCNGLRLSGTTHINSPKSHIHINGCQDVQIGNLRILAPEDSANTDGIDISQSSHVLIYHSIIGTGCFRDMIDKHFDVLVFCSGNKTGDDCVAIGDGTYDIHVNGISCGPGHGIRYNPLRLFFFKNIFPIDHLSLTQLMWFGSVGSLGRDGSFAAVEQVYVKNCSIYGTQNGLRIKTVPFGKGYARGIIYEDIRLHNVGNPIIIDQHYCLNTENHYCPAPVSAICILIVYQEHILCILVTKTWILISQRQMQYK